MKALGSVLTGDISKRPGIGGIAKRPGTWGISNHPGGGLLKARAAVAS